jgi:hypothetical protein
MIARGKTVAIALAAALGTVACATAPDRLEVPKVVVGIACRVCHLSNACTSRSAIGCIMTLPRTSLSISTFTITRTP